eukprot:2218453-Prymnesium_polylepis.1
MYTCREGSDTWPFRRRLASARRVSDFFPKSLGVVSEWDGFLMPATNCMIRVSFRVPFVLNATTSGRGMNFHPFAKFSICSPTSLQGTDSPQHLWCVQLGAPKQSRLPKVIE